MIPAEEREFKILVLTWLQLIGDISVTGYREAHHGIITELNHKQKDYIDSLDALTKRDYERYRP